MNKLHEWGQALIGRVQSTFVEYEYARPIGATVAIRRYLGVLAVLIPLHTYLAWWFSRSIGVYHDWGVAVATAHSLMILPAILMFVACLYVIQKGRCEQLLLMAINAVYIGLGARLSYLDLTHASASNLGGSTYLMCSLATSVMYLAPPYVTVPFFITALGSAALSFYTLDPSVYTTHPGLLINMGVASLMTIAMSYFVWQHFSAKTLLEKLLRQASSDLGKAHEELDNLQEADPMTGLYNKRKFCEITNRDWARAARTGHTGAGSLLIIDIDFLGQVNTKYGTLVGDTVIKRVAGVVSRHIRGTDVAGRVGGDVFSVFLPDTAREGAERVAEKIRAGVEEYTVVIPATGGNSRVEIKVTVSIGLATWVSGANVVKIRPDDLTLLADYAMHGAKDAGRNQIMGT